jgi:TonB family protein
MFHMLRVSQLLIPILLVATCFAEDRNWEEANQLLVKASEAETFKPEQPKFHLTVKVLLQHTTKGRLAGTFVRDYMAPERWADRLEIGDFREERVRIEKQIWTKKSQDFVPLQVDQLFKALFTTTFQMVQSDVVNRVHNRKLEGTEARCIEFRNAVGRKSTDGEICVDRAAGTVVYWKYGQIEIWYSNYVPFSGRVRPSHFVVAEQGTPSVEGDVTYTLASELSADSFSPLKDAEVQDICSTTRALIAKQTPDPFFPPGLSAAQYRGAVVIRAEVDETGHVRKEAVIESVHPIVDGAALAAVKQWTFEPKLCDGKAVSTVTRLDVRFRH